MSIGFCPILALLPFTWMRIAFHLNLDSEKQDEKSFCIAVYWWCCGVGVLAFPVTSSSIHSVMCHFILFIQSSFYCQKWCGHGLLYAQSTHVDRVQLCLKRLTCAKMRKKNLPLLYIHRARCSQTCFCVCAESTENKKKYRRQFTSQRCHRFCHFYVIVLKSRSFLLFRFKITFVLLLCQTCTKKAGKIADSFCAFFIFPHFVQIPFRIFWLINPWSARMS